MRWVGRFARVATPWYSFFSLGAVTKGPTPSPPSIPLSSAVDPGRRSTNVGPTSRSVRMGLRPTNSDENLAVGQALGLRRPLRPPGRALNNLRWVFDRARVLQDELFATGRRGRRPQDWSPALRGHAALRDSRRMRRQSDQEWPYRPGPRRLHPAGHGSARRRPHG